MSITLQSPLVIEIKLIKYARLKVKRELNREGKIKKGWMAAILSCVFNLVWIPFPRCQRMWCSRQHQRPLSYFNIKVSIWLKVKTPQSPSSTYSVMPAPIHFFWSISIFFFFTDIKLLKKGNKAWQEVLMQSMLIVLHHFENGLCLHHIWMPRGF